jgi:tetrahydromethanopterin S-methyltransferase subunit B
MENLVIIENETQLKEKIDVMKKALTVKKTSLSSFKRRKISAADSRASAAVIGSTLGVTLIVLVIALIIASDVQRLYSDVKHGLCRCMTIIRSTVGEKEIKAFFKETCITCYMID